MCILSSMRCRVLISEAILREYLEQIKIESRPLKNGGSSMITLNVGN
jgi:hypothetical protein